MKTISKENRSVRECLGFQEYHKWKQYRELPYTLKLHVQDGMLWYNLLTREVLFLSSAEAELIAWNVSTMMARLVHKWYLIPEDVDARTLVYMFWQNYLRRNPLRMDSTLTLATIFTTTKCNAGCYYCYEAGTRRCSMNMETAECTADYLIRKAGNGITLKWFGGEPLLNSNVIDLICRRLEAAGVNFSSYMVTNGYLLDEISDEQIWNVWRLKHVQITIDGTREFYAKTKGLPEDAYERVLKSVERLARMGITVMIRSHITNENEDVIKALVKELMHRFSCLGDAQKQVHFYVTPLYEGLGHNPEPIDENKRDQLYNACISIDRMLYESGIDHGRNIPGVKASHCMADNCRSIVIAPDGSLTPCEHCHDREVIGSVLTGGHIPDKWFERTPELQECGACFYYPQCIRLRMCDSESPCNAAMRKWKKHLAESAMLHAYGQYKSRRKNSGKSI